MEGDRQIQLECGRVFVDCSQLVYRKGYIGQIWLVFGIGYVDYSWLEWKRKSRWKLVII